MSEYADYEEEEAAEPDQAGEDEPGTYEEPESWQFGDQEYSAEDLEKIVEDFQNNKNWKTSNQNKSEKIKAEREEFTTYQDKEKARLQQREQKIRDREVKTGKLYQQKQQLTADEKKEIHFNCRQATLDLQREFEDYDMDEQKEYHKKYNIAWADDANPHDVMKLLYFACRGEKIESIIAEAKNVWFREMKKTKGLPSIAGGQPSSMDEQPVKTKEDFIKRMRGKLKW